VSVLNRAERKEKQAEKIKLIDGITRGVTRAKTMRDE
jgi:hypothetical protein